MNDLASLSLSFMALSVIDYLISCLILAKLDLILSLF